MNQIFVSFVVGFLFALGLAFAGMTQPHIVIGFLDPMNWDPTLIFVMIGAISVHSVSFFFLKKRKTPFLASKWHLAPHRKMDKQLVIGSVIFGLGWGLGGYCPGPALASLASGSLAVLGFFLMMILGMKIANIVVANIIKES